MSFGAGTPVSFGRHLSAGPGRISSPALWGIARRRKQQPAAPDVEQVQRLASGTAKASLVEIRTGSEEEIAVWQREKEKAMQRQVNRLREEVLTAASADASLEDIRVQQNDNINKLLNAEKMSAKQLKDALQQHVAEQRKKKVSDGTGSRMQ